MRADGIANVTVNALHPASLMPTTMVMQGGYSISTLEEGVEATLRLIDAPDVEGTSGRYYDGLREARAKPQADDAAARRKLWKLSESLVRDRV
ncbi:MAG: short-chain dehydrogenase/reductase [Candidatus Eremiobacteraeota bacterium]|jgi:hypothetical protein|nr:short-chain dehydrogenase/reductase [Candidatus Eremiobacteraeota bacterium]